MKTCEALADAGAAVVLVIPGRKTPIAEDAFSYYDVKKNFALTALITPDLVKRWGPFGFALSALWFSEAARWRKSFWKADIIYSRDAFVLAQYVLLGRKLVYEAHTKPTAITAFVAKYAYALVVISEGLRDAYIQKGIFSEKIIVAHDAIAMEPFKKHYDQKESRAWLGIPGERKVALYVGRIESAKGADTFAAASDYLTDDWLAVLIGAGSLTGMLKKKYPKALLLPETPYRELPRVLASADVLVLPNSSKDEDASKYTSPLKAFAYMASGKPIVASDVPALRMILKSGIGFFEADNEKSCALAIMNMNQKTRKGETVYSWYARARDILEALNLL
jgi:glycosyltransferase involved in cell wall biosynthesis